MMFARGLKALYYMLVWIWSRLRLSLTTCFGDNSFGWVDVFGFGKRMRTCPCQSNAPRDAAVVCWGLFTQSTQTQRTMTWACVSVFVSLPPLRYSLLVDGVSVEKKAMELNWAGRTQNKNLRAILSECNH